ncbi:MAG: tetratricopeptide repeat protein [Alphaproteobacteria bacterium]|nr:tetratricopeptide repeat protein [Alphaproteobacteria bacterium]
MGQTAQNSAQIQADGDKLAKLREQAAALYKAGRTKSAIKAQQRLVELAGDQAAKNDWAFLGLYYFAAGAELRCAEIMEEALERFPDSSDFLNNAVVGFLRGGQPKRAEPYLERALEKDPTSPLLHDAAARLFFDLGQLDRSIEHGSKSLVLKDEEAAKVDVSAHELAAVPVPSFDATRPERNVIAFSLWGDNERYVQGAIKNAELAAHIYPGWVCRFYCDETVPQRALAAFAAAGAEVNLMPPQSRLYEGLFWRFAVAFDDSLDRYIVRDADSLISVRERLAVEDWISSPQHFHVLRDFYTHTDPMLAGLWGGVRGSVPAALNGRMQRYFDDPAKTANADQKFLREQVWPIARTSVVIHDSKFVVLGAKPYPQSGMVSRDEHHLSHIGSNAHVLKSAPARGMSGKLAGKPLEARKQCIFTIAPGRTGTAFLAELLRSNVPRAEVHHERMGLGQFGLHSPDISHMMRFNTEGNVHHIHEFWRRKAALIASGGGPVYAEISHLLAKAGLMENVGLICQTARVDIVLLRRDIAQTVQSFIARGDFINTGLAWAFLLDWNYPRRVVDPGPFQQYGMVGRAYWYVVEMFARGEFYRQRLAGVPNLHFHVVELSELSSVPGAETLMTALGFNLPDEGLALPSKQNKRTLELFPQLSETVMDVVRELAVDPVAEAGAFQRKGGWLG